MKIIQKGNAVSKGIGMGPAYIYQQYICSVEIKLINECDAKQHLVKYENTREKAILEVHKIIDFIRAKDDDKAKIFEAHIQIIGDVIAIREINRLILKQLFSYQSAIKKVYDNFIEQLSKVEDDIIKERVADLKDVRDRLLRISEGIEEINLSSLEQNAIIIAHDLYPSDAATIDRNKVQGIITQVGGVTSHTTIIAKSYGIPTILGVNNIFAEVKHNDYIIVDAVNNTIYINPDKAMINEYQSLKAEYQVKQDIINRYIDVKPVTIDSVQIDIALNIGSANKEELDFESYVDGVGLFRTEFLFMRTKEMPSEEKQFKKYKKVLTTFSDRPVVIRTMDIGGDKELKYLTTPKEDNPFLGKRAIRLCFDNIALFKTQIKAALRASIFGDLWLMFPMVGSMDDIYLLKEIIAEVESDLTDNQIKFNKDYKMGVMIEIPSLALIADQVAQEVDFASIGTNDLCQYLQAVDRLNPLVSKYYQSYSPSMFRIMKIVIDAFNKADKPLSVCGELGGDVMAAAVLIGLGIRKLSMNSTSIASIKQMIAKHLVTDFESIAKHVIDLKTEKEVIKYIKFQLKIAK